MVWVAITPKGLKLLDEMDEPINRLHREQFSHMTHEECVELSRLLVKATEPSRNDAVSLARARFFADKIVVTIYRVNA